MNGNPFTANWIGATGEYPIYDKIKAAESVSSNFTIYNSNILETHLNDTSNILQTQITATSNLIYKDDNLNTIVRITAQNPFYPLSGDPVEMLFQNVNNVVKTKINQDGELMVYHPLAPLPAGYSAGWWGVENKIANIITDAQGLRFDITNLQAATGATAITNSSTATAAAAGAAAGAASAAATTAAAGATITGGDYGSVALGVAGGALFSVLGFLSYQAQVASNLNSNGFTLEAEQVKSYITTANELVADNIGNIITGKGFVHSNMLYAQNYISSNNASNIFLLKSENINLNQVNNWISTEYGTYYDITDGTLAINATPTQEDFLKVGGQTTIQGELIAEGNIKENNLYLSSVYSTINNVDITSNILNTKIDNTTNNVLYLSDVYTTETSNLLNSKIDTYPTSNVVKDLIIYDTPQVYKRSAFYCYTDEIIYPNGGSTPYYTHHIDLRLYTKTGYTIQNDPYRIFKIKCFFETSYFQKLTNGTPDICEYSINMSSKAAAGGEGSIAGINIMAIGTPQNYFLNNIMNTNLFILRNANNNFNYLSIVSTQNADVRVFITDELN